MTWVLGIGNGRSWWNESLPFILQPSFKLLQRIWDPWMGWTVVHGSVNKGKIDRNYPHPTLEWAHVLFVGELIHQGRMCFLLISPLAITCLHCFLLCSKVPLTFRCNFSRHAGGYRRKRERSFCHFFSVCSIQPILLKVREGKKAEVYGMC